jgi:hypothetical protein
MLAVEYEDATIEFLTTPAPCRLCGTMTNQTASRHVSAAEVQKLGMHPSTTAVATHLCDECANEAGFKRLERVMWAVARRRKL